MNKTIIFLFLVVFTFGCKNDTLKSTELKKGFYTLKATGESKSGSYTFCGFVPTEVNYNYRIGNWKFTTNDTIKIAEGEYDVVIKVDDSSGGCEFKYFDNTVDLKKWRFWDKSGQPIEPTKRLINLIESRHTEQSFYLE